jgi:L-asparaginase
VLACFNGELYAARDVTKVHTSAIETFQSYGHGAVGVVDGEQVVVYRRPQLRVHLTPLDLSKRVPLIKAVIGIDDGVLDPILATGIDGLVVEAFGRGNLSAELGQRLARVCGGGVPVVVTSRCPERTGDADLRRRRWRPRPGGRWRRLFRGPQRTQGPAASHGGTC